MIIRVPLEGGRSPHQAHPSEGVVVREQRVRQAGNAIWLVVNILPVGIETRCSLRKWSKQVGIQLVHYLLVHAGFKLSGKEGGPHCLLQKQGRRRAEEWSGDKGDKEENKGRRLLNGVCQNVRGTNVMCVEVTARKRREKKADKR